MGARATFSKDITVGTNLEWKEFKKFSLMNQDREKYWELEMDWDITNNLERTLSRLDNGED